MSDEWVSISEAARRLSAAGDPVDRSTLSRYLKQHAEALPLRPSGRYNLVDFAALVAHRKENIRIASAAAPVAPPEPAQRAGFTQADAAARDRMAVAEMRELDLAKRRREVTPVGEVDQAARDAIALMNSAFDRAIESEAASLSVKFGWEERTLRLALKAFTRKGVDVFHREVLKMVDDLGRRDDARSEPLPAGAIDVQASLQ